MAKMSAARKRHPDMTVSLSMSGAHRWRASAAPGRWPMPLPPVPSPEPAPAGWRTSRSIPAEAAVTSFSCCFSPLLHHAGPARRSLLRSGGTHGLLTIPVMLACCAFSPRPRHFPRQRGNKKINKSCMQRTYFAKDARDQAFSLLPMLRVSLFFGVTRNTSAAHDRVPKRFSPRFKTPTSSGASKRLSSICFIEKETPDRREIYAFSVYPEKKAAFSCTWSLDCSYLHVYSGQLSREHT